MKVNVRVKLTIQDRINLMGMLPKRGNIMTLTIVDDILEKTKISQEVFKNIEAKPIGNNEAIAWNPKKAEEFNNEEFEFTESEVSLLKQTIKELDGKKEVHMQNLRLVKKFLEL